MSSKSANAAVAASVLAAAKSEPTSTAVPPVVQTTGTDAANPAPSSSAAEAKTPELLKTGGPTIEEFVKAGYPADKYPPAGYAEVASPALVTFKATGKMPEPKPEPAKPKPLLDAKGELTVAGHEYLCERLAVAAEAIGRGLRIINGNRLQPGQKLRGEIENAFETARRLAHGKATVKALADAAQMQATVTTFLANVTLQNPHDLVRARQELAKSLAVVKQLTPAT